MAQRRKIDNIFGRGYILTGFELTVCNLHIVLGQIYPGSRGLFLLFSLQKGEGK
jgi:hypothetical protein